MRGWLVVTTGGEKVLNPEKILFMEADSDRACKITMDNDEEFWVIATVKEVRDSLMESDMAWIGAIERAKEETRTVKMSEAELTELFESGRQDVGRSFGGEEKC